MMKKLLLTGFEPFLGYPINPTMEVVKVLDKTIINDFEVHGKILTVDFASSGKELLEEIDAVKPDAVISLGLAGGRFKVTPERIAINVSHGDKDNKGNKPSNEPIFHDGDDGIFTTLPIEKMVERLMSAHLPAEISNSAGTYLCNNVMYHALYQLQKTEQNIPSGFIHIPASHELAVEHKKIASWSQTDLIEAIRMCIKCLD